MRVQEKFIKIRTMRLQSCEFQGREVGFDSIELKQAVTESFSEMPEEMSSVLQEDFNISSVERFIEILKVFNRETGKGLTK